MLAQTDQRPYTIDEIFEFLGYHGSAQDREADFLKEAGYTTGSIESRWDKFLVAKGYTRGDVAHRQRQWLHDTILVSPARRNKGFSITPSEVEMTKTDV